jgi:hypothetical protein
MPRRPALLIVAPLCLGFASAAVGFGGLGSAGQEARPNFAPSASSGRDIECPCDTRATASPAAELAAERQASPFPSPGPAVKGGPESPADNPAPGNRADTLKDAIRDAADSIRERAQASIANELDVTQPLLPAGNLAAGQPVCTTESNVEGGSTRTAIRCFAHQQQVVTNGSSITSVTVTSSSVTSSTHSP